jgi:hypothetical protein
MSLKEQSESLLSQTRELQASKVLRRVNKYEILIYYITFLLQYANNIYTYI